MRSLIVAAASLCSLACSGHEPRGLGPLAEQATVLGHRGAAGLAPENTDPAFAAAAELGVGFELDVALTADGQVVVIHDHTLDRTTDGTGPVEATDWRDLSGLDAGSWYDARFAGTPLPTLDQVLGTYADQVLIDIELKTTERRQALAEAVVEVVRRHDAIDRVVVTSFDPYLLGAVAEAEPRILRGQLTATFRDAELGLVQKLVLRHVGLKRASKPDFIAVEQVRATPRYVRRWQRRGYAVLAWTVNDPARMARLREAGVDGIITDRPDLALGPGRGAD